jgi:hypothetical protein
MQFDGKSLIEILHKTDGPIDVRDEAGSRRYAVPRRVALALAERGDYVGVGNLRRIRYMRPLARGASLRAGSRFTRPVRADASCRIHVAGQVIGCPRANQEFTP